MSSRKRPLAEISQAHSTPSRYAPSTPHAIRALQQRSGAKTRSARSTRHVSANTVRPDSIRGVLKQFAKISAPVTKKRVVTPGSVYVDKENQRPNDAEEDDNDSVLLKKPNLTFTIDESIEDEDSELPVAPTPSVLPDDEDDDQPTITFQNVTSIPLRRPASERSDRRISTMSRLHSEPLRAENNGDDEDDIDMTIMTERGRRAVSEEATGRLSRYSFGGLRMSDFGSELEIQRESDIYGKAVHTDLDDYLVLGDDSIHDNVTEDLRAIQRLPSIELENDTLQLSAVQDDTFRFDVPSDDEATNHVIQAQGLEVNDTVVPALSILHSDSSVVMRRDDENEVSSRRQTLLEVATTKSHTSRRKRLKLTRHGTTVPSLPKSLVKRIVLDSYDKQSKRKPTLGHDHMKALEQATEWFFEQVGEDLAAFSSHGRRKKRVDTDDVLLLMRRQKVLSEGGELRKLAKNWLPKDVLDGLDLPDAV